MHRASRERLAYAVNRLGLETSRAYTRLGTAEYTTSRIRLKRVPVWKATSRRPFSQRGPTCEPPEQTRAMDGGAPTAAAGDAATTPIFSSNVPDADAAQDELSALLVPHGRWVLSASRQGVERTFQFKTFKATWAFMDAVAAECRKERHHPEWANVYSRTHVRWTTHKPEGLSLKDLKMARICDEKAAEFGEEAPAAQSTAAAGGKGDALHDMSNHIAEDACDVCAR